MNSERKSDLLNRRHFTLLSAGLVSGLGIPAVCDGVIKTGGEETKGTASLDASYIEKGLTGMARSKGWFNAHLGAAVLAGYYMCRENQFSDALVANIRQQLDLLISTFDDQFAPFEHLKADESLVEKVPLALGPAVEGGLRAHGHAAIYTALSVRALRDAPQLAAPQIIDQLCQHNAAIALQPPRQPKMYRDYADKQAMIEAYFDCMAQFSPLLGRPSVPRPNFVHMTTHTEALMTLDELGYHELARIGQLGQQAHIEEAVPEFDPAEHPLGERQATLADVMNEDFWKNEDRQKLWNGAWNVETNRNGYWLAFGHLFKVLYSYHRLIRHIDDKEKVRLVSQILLERVVNPNVGGG